MQVILLEKIQNLGDLGETVKVKPGYGRNFLVPTGKAVPATAANVAEFEARRAELEKVQAGALAEAQSRMQAIASIEAVTIERKAGDEGKLFGSVGTPDIAEAVSALAGVEVTRDEVRLPSGALRVVGEYEIDIHLHADVNTSVRVVIAAEA